MKETVIIADIAGQFNALQRLMSRFPREQEFIFVGDLVDRGPDSDKVIELAMKNPRVTTLLGNHEHMMLDFINGYGFYQQGLWLYNGGGATHRCYNYEPPEDVIHWLEKLPLYKMLDGCLVTHAPLDSSAIGVEWLDNQKTTVTGEFDLQTIWNRNKPKRREYFQVFGHNSNWGLMSISDEAGKYALCIDQSQREMLTAFCWPSKNIVTEPYTPEQTFAEELAAKMFAGDDEVEL